MSRSNVLNSDDIEFDEYYLKNDLLNYTNSIIYDENTTKRIDRLLLFRFELNTHSTSVRMKHYQLYYIKKNYFITKSRKYRSNYLNIHVIKI